MSSVPGQELDPGLVSRTAAIDPAAPGELMGLAGDDGFAWFSSEVSLVGWGRALTLTLPRGLRGSSIEDAQAPLRAIRPDDTLGRWGTGPLALGALPFDPRATGRLVVPELVVGLDATGAWATVVGDEPSVEKADLEGLVEERRLAVRAASRSAANGRPMLPTPEASPFGVRPEPDPQAFVAAVAAARQAIDAGPLSKVVLGRRLDVDLSAPPDPVDVLARLRQREPTSTGFCFPVDSGHFVGASPELLVARRDRRVRSGPLAGTTRLEDGPGTGEVDGGPSTGPDERLLQSPKEREEHGLVVRAVADILAPRCEQLSVPDRPRVVRLGSDARLGTLIEGTLRDGAGSVPTGALDLLAALHPTPAVGGVPSDEALEAIARAEPASRGYWAGPVGWTGANGDGEWFIGIRSLTLCGSHAEVWAGAGIVAASDPEAELAETSLKLDPVLEVLRQASGSATRR